MSKKYELSEETNSAGLFRIKALKSFNSVQEGDFGGFVSSENNLSQSGEAWVSGNAEITNVTIYAGFVQIGCEFHSESEWDKFTDDQILAMDGDAALKFWKEHKKRIIV